MISHKRLFYALLLFLIAISTANAADIYEAEDATVVGAAISSTAAGYTGTGFVDFENSSGDYIEWTINASKAGPVDLSFRYALFSGDLPLELKVNNNVAFPSLSFPATGSFLVWDYTTPVQITLNAGVNTVRATAIGSGGANLDHLSIETMSNYPPTVNAGQDRIIHVPREYLTITGTISDDGQGSPEGFIGITWSQISGPATVEFMTDIHQSSVNLHFPAVGDYELQLIATDGLLNSSDVVTITVADPNCPVGDIDGDCIVSLADLRLLASSWLDDTGTSDADLDGDKRVNFDELSLISQSFGDDWTGSLKVTISPQEAVAAGAMWRVSGGDWQLSGTTVSGIPQGSHDIEFSFVSEWLTPKAQKVQITKHQTTFASGEYLDMSQAIVINEFMAGNSYIPFTSPLNIKTRVYGWDSYPDWIELHNISAQAIDVGGMYLTDDDDLLTKWRFPDNTMIGPNGYLIVFASGKTAEEYASNYPYVDDWGSLHTNFELSSDGEYLALVQADGQTVMHSYGPEYPRQRGLVSYGLTNAGTAGYLTEPTPGTLTNNRWTGAANTGVYSGVVGDTKFSVKRGFFNTPFEVLISCGTPGALIYYTTDSSEPVDIDGNPTSAAKLYSASNKPQIMTTTCLRAAAIKYGWLPSDIDTQTYIFTEDVLDQAAPVNYAASWGGYPADYKLEDDSTDIKLVAGNAGYTVSQARAVIKNSLLTIPTLSVVSHADNLFASSSKGIYLNTTSTGINWERFCSAELFDPQEGTKFQLNCGLRVQGGASRNPRNAPKHSLSLRFRSGYGPGKLNHKLFPGSPVDSFNALQLRAMYNNSWIHWSHDQRLRGSMIRDQWVRDSLIDMGNSSAGHGTYVHLYLNGLYWGVYNLHERQEASHYGEHFDVDPDTLDAITSNNAADGNMNSWNSLQALAANASSDGNIDLSEYNSIRSKLDVLNLCDYMITNHFGANHDWHDNNWRAVGGGVNNAPWKIYSWDAERILEGIAANELNSEGSNSPRLLFSRMRYSEEFNMLLADRVHKHYFNNGPLTSENAAQCWMNRANTLDQAIIGESARWGDYRRDVHVRGTAYLFTRNDHWIVEQDRLMYSYFNVTSGLNRSEQVLQNQYIPNGYYPSVHAPVFYINELYQHGGYVNTNDILTMINPGGSGTIYYTLDGSDPRLPGGAVNPLAQEFEIGTSTTKQDVVMVEPGSAVWKYLYDGSDQGTAWQQLGFSDNSWGSGPGELGFGDGDENTYIGPKVRNQMSAYFRHKFNIPDASDVIDLTINLKYDDGAVIYINEQEVGRVNLPGGTVSYNTAAIDAKENATTVITGISPSVLVDGSNVLAVELHQNQGNSSDMSFDLGLTATVSVTGGNPSQEVLAESTMVKARVLNEETWSALNEAVYAVGPVADSLRISEIMYNPADPNTEYIELTNIGSQAINLSGVKFTRGITFTFPSLSLAPGEFVLVVGDLAAFEAFYDTTGWKIAGQYIGQLSNDGEKIELKDVLSTQIHLFDYSDNWYDVTDGGGFSLTIKDPPETDLNLWDQKAGWRPSAASGGSPGIDDSSLLPPLGSIVINEVLAHSHAESPDWIELHNTTENTIDISGWFLSDNNNDDPNIMKYEIPAGTEIIGGDYLVFYENESFGNPANAAIPFGLSEGGDEVYLHSGAGGAITGYVQEESFGASATGVAFGRYYKASTDSCNFVAMETNTPGWPNAAPMVGPVAISEIHYNPQAKPGDSYDNDEYEFIEILNITGSPVTMQEYDSLLGVTVPWKFTSGIDYTFPLGTTINSGQRLVIARNLAAYAERYGSSAGVLGPFDNDTKLSNGGEKLDLSKPGDQEEGVRYYIRVDRVNYSDGSHPVGEDPWPTTPDGAGDSLDRLVDAAYGNDVSNWQASTPNPGSD